jgi:formylglycine-generating enzyme
VRFLFIFKGHYLALLNCLGATIMKTAICVIAVSVVFLFAFSAYADVFNLGPNLTNLEMVTVGNPQNADDQSNAYGSVNYIYQIGKFEVTTAQYTAFLNAVAKADPYGLYNSTAVGGGMAGSNGCGIQRSGASGNYTYSVASDWANRPVNWVNFWDAARFANWLQNGQPLGAEVSSTTERGAYTLDGYTGTDGRSIVRNADAKWVIPDKDMWCKAAYYDPNKGGIGAPGYWKYPTKSDTVPVCELPPGRVEPPGSANYLAQHHLDPVYRTTIVGAYTQSASFYGTFDQGGNVNEWTEDVISGSNRTYCGGSFDNGSTNMIDYGFAHHIAPNYEDYHIGFRVAYIPEPSTIALLLTATLGGMLWWRRRA